jgi:squalene-hopene/tetraprenyl-beta-curcumene cyclase
MHRHLASLALLTAAALVARVHAQTDSVRLSSSKQPAGTLSPSVARETRAAVDRALAWLAAGQRPDGSWSNAKFPALTALAMQAFALSGRDGYADTVARARKFVLSCVKPDGGIYVNVPGVKGGGLSNYNTAICMTALHALGDPALDRVILDARKFVAAAQHFGDDIYRGGFGYDKSTKRAYTDLLNTYYATQAMKATQDVEDRRDSSEAKVDINWAETVKFVQKLQNPPGTGEERGGFFYNPTDPKAGTSETEDGTVVFRAYGSITYAGLLALIYADVSRDDVRVRSAFDWAFRHWSLEENPGMGQQGVFFFYCILSRCLKASGHDVVPVGDDTFVNWRADLAAKLVSLQKVDGEGRGYWVNKVGRYWENDPVLVTAYSLLALHAVNP